MSKRVRAIATFLVDFVVGDDWRVALGVVVAILATWLLHRAGVAAWWLLPAAVVGLLVTSVRRQARPGP